MPQTIRAVRNVYQTEESSLTLSAVEQILPGPEPG